MDSRSALAAKTCAPWRSACSSSTPATEVCDDRSCHNRNAGGVALPQPGQHLYDVSREVKRHNPLGRVADLFVCWLSRSWRNYDARDNTCRAGPVSWGDSQPRTDPSSDNEAVFLGSKLTREELARVATPAATATLCERRNQFT